MGSNEGTEKLKSLLLPGRFGDLYNGRYKTEVTAGHKHRSLLLRNNSETKFCLQLTKTLFWITIRARRHF